MGNPYKLTVKLNQITPLLHFQGDTQGACLRASEVKPKLDRFLWDYFDRKGVKIPETWELKTEDKPKVGYHSALRYKMQFSGEMEEEPITHLLYFAQNMGGNSKALMSRTPIEMTVLSLCQENLTGDFPLYQEPLKDPTLVEIISALLPVFFALHCFGTRSGKGFGSFEVAGRNVSDQELDFYKESGCLKLYHLSSTDRNYTVQQCQDDICILSGMMKGGFNRPYFKGEIQKALWSKNLGSDKAFVKSKIFPYEIVDPTTGQTLENWYQTVVCGGTPARPNKSNTDWTYSDHRYIRAMLGLADHYDYGVGKDEKKKKTIQVKAQDEKINRFANPVRFKPCQGGFLILVWKVPEVLQGIFFDFSFSKKAYPLQTPSKAYPLQTPSDAEFDLVKFVDEFLSWFDRHRWGYLSNKDCQLFYGKGDDRNRPINFGNTLNKLKIDYYSGKEESK